MKNQIKNWLKGIAVGGLITLGSMFAKDAKAAPTFEGDIGESNGIKQDSSITYIVKPDKSDTTDALPPTYSKRRDMWKWSVTAPTDWGLVPGDTCDIFTIDSSGQRANTWREITGAGGHLTIPLYPAGYSIGIKDITSPNSDTLMEGRCKIKHNGNYSDEIVDTFNTKSSYYDGKFNLAESESVKTWCPTLPDTGSNGKNARDWNKLIGDSIFVDGKGINVNEIGESRGIFQRKFKDGDTLTSILLHAVGIDESKPKYLEYTIDRNPCINSAIIYKTGKFAVELYDRAGRLVDEKSGEEKVEIGCKAPSGAYFAKIYGKAKDASTVKLIKLK
ncbi:MAG: hypothetical protein WC475_02850 [Candidatus Paceibacterota bacterium]